MPHENCSLQHRQAWYKSQPQREGHAFSFPFSLERYMENSSMEAGRQGRRKKRHYSIL